MKEIKEVSLEMLHQQHFDCFAVGVIDFQSKSFECFEISPSEGFLEINEKPKLHFDLASVSKVLNLASSYQLKPEIFSNDMLHLLSHRAGLPAWGLLHHDNWKEVLNQYPIRESETLYSDYSALRLMLEIEKASGQKLKDIVSVFWDKDMLFWKDLHSSHVCPETGYRHNSKITSCIHDPNAFVINDYSSHAGVFSRVDALCSSMLNLDKLSSFVSNMEKSRSNNENRFCFGWDTVEDPDNTLAGKGCSEKTFGHLGFTGTSLWIDPIKKRGSVILSNGTKEYWYEKSGLNKMRRKIGELIWKL